MRQVAVWPRVRSDRATVRMVADENRDFLDLILGFVEGRISPAAFREVVYDQPAIADFLNDEGGRRPPWLKESTYLCVIQADYDDLNHTGRALAALEAWLERHGVPYTMDQRHEELHTLMLAVQPRWLAMDGGYFNKLLAEAGERESGELRTWLKAEVRRRFVSVKRPPRWMQSPAWPIGPNGPLVFLGQLSVGRYFHDEGFVYVFLDPRNGQVETVIQVC